MARFPWFGLRARLILLVLLAVVPALIFVIITIADHIQPHHLIGLSIALFLALAAAWIGGDIFILRRIRSLLRATDRLASGDLSARTDLRYGVGELSQLSRSFDRMAEALKQRQEERQDAEEQILRQNRDLAALNTITAAISSSLELPEILESLRNLLAEKLHVPGGALLFYNITQDVLNVEAAWGIPAAVLAEFKGLPANCYHYEAVIRRKETILRPDLRQVMPYSERGLGDVRPNWLSYLSVPLVAKGQVQGVLDLFSQSPNEFSENHIVLFTALGQQVGVAIQNARLYEQVRSSQQRLQLLSKQLLDVQEGERRHISRELHDEIGQALTAVKVNLQSAKRLDRQGEITPHFEESISIIEQALQQVRDLSLDLRPSILDDLGVVSALRWYIDRQARRAGFQVQFSAEVPDLRLPVELETTCFRLAQEALTNIVRHAHAKNVWVVLRKLDTVLELVVRDDGVGFDTGSAPDRTAGELKLGLLGMQERVELVGGYLHIESSLSQGTEIRAYIPLSLPQTDTEQVDRRSSEE